MMKHRPWPIVFLAFCYWFEPVFHCFYYSLLYGTSPLFYLAKFWADKHWAFNVLMSALFPLAGVAIWSYRRWSLPVVLGIHLLVCLLRWVDGTGVFALGMGPEAISVIVFIIINLLVVTYLLLPPVFLSFYQQNKHWWKQHPRFCLPCPAQFSQVPAFSTTGEIIDISLSGLAVKANENLEINQIYQVGFRYGGLNFHYPLRIIRKFPDGTGYGAQFDQLTFAQKMQLKRLVQALHLLAAETPTWKKDDFNWGNYLQWATKLVKTGKALFQGRN